MGHKYAYTKQFSYGYPELNKLRKDVAEIFPNAIQISADFGWNSMHVNSILWDFKTELPGSTKDKINKALKAYLGSLGMKSGLYFSQHYTHHQSNWVQTVNKEEGQYILSFLGDWDVHFMDIKTDEDMKTFFSQLNDIKDILSKNLPKSCKL